MTPIEKKARERAEEVLHDIIGLSIQNQLPVIAAALLAWGNERLEEAAKKLEKLRDSPQTGGNAWKVGRITGLESAIYVIQKLKE